eukprot:scaffold261_cov170-Amphora_coffeaeformis.AAC.19
MVRERRRATGSPKKKKRAFDAYNDQDQTNRVIITKQMKRGRFRSLRVKEERIILVGVKGRRGYSNRS